MVAVGGTLLAGLLSRRLLLPALSPWATRTTWAADEELLNSLRRPWMPWFALLGTYLGFKMLELDSTSTLLLKRVILTVFIITLTFWLANLFIHLLTVSLSGRGERALIVSGVTPEFQPLIRYHTFRGSSIDFTAILRAPSYVDNFLVKHEFSIRLASKFAQEGIVIPHPIRAINLDQESRTRAPDSGGPSIDGGRDTCPRA
jgi:hypothetical protein